MTLKKPLMFGVVIFGLLLLIVGAGFYLLKTVDINTAKGVVEIVNPKSYMENGLFSQAHYMKYAVVPSRYTEADTVYRLTVGNGSVEREDKFYWTQLELDIQKPKLIKHGITKDEYIAIAQKPHFDIEIHEIRSERDGNYLMWSVVYVGIVGLLLMVISERKPKVEKRIPSVRQHLQGVKLPDVLPDEEQLQKCFQCPSFKMLGGILRCGREECKY